MADQAIYAPQRVLDANGDPVPGALVDFYITSTTTRLDLFEDSDGTVSAANPVVADANGYLPQRFYDGIAKAVIKTAAGATLFTLDPVPKSLSGSAGAGQVTYSATALVPVTNVQDAIDLLAENADTLAGSLGGLSGLDSITTTQFSAATLVTESEGIAGNDNDTTIPTSAAVKDYTDTRAAMTLLGTIATTSGTSVSLGSLSLTGYKFLRFVVAGVSGDASITISLGGVRCSDASGSASGALYGVFDLDLTAGIFMAAVGVAAANVASWGGATSYTTASTSIAFTASGGNFDAGSIRVYGIR